MTEFTQVEGIAEKVAQEFQAKYQLLNSKERSLFAIGVKYGILYEIQEITDRPVYDQALKQVEVPYH